MSKSAKNTLIILLLLSALAFIPAHPAGARGGQKRTITIYSSIAGAEVQLLRTEAETDYLPIGQTQKPIPYTIEGTGAGMRLVFINTLNSTGIEIPAVVGGKDGALLLQLMHGGYVPEKIRIPFDYLLTHTGYPDVRAGQKPVILKGEKCTILFRTKPPGARVYAEIITNPQSHVYLGKADRPITIEKTSFPGSNRHNFYLDHDFYRRQVIQLQISTIKAGTTYTTEVVALKPRIPVISFLLFSLKYHLLTTAAVILFSFIALWLLITKAILLPLNRYKADVRRLEAWNALSRRVDREDPMYNRLIGKYRILEKLGAGGMATVYKAVPEATLDDKEAVAIKIMQGDKADDSEFSERFKREMRISTEMNHPNILRILDFGDDDGVLYIVMELVRGKPLRKVIPDAGYDLEGFMEVYRPILQALKYAHEKNVIHRDLKPDNIMIDDLGRVIVMDFGLARHQGGSMITASGVAIGTPAYMSPEQVSGKTLDARTDQYSLGILAFQMLTGQLPFYDENTINIMFKHVSDPPPPLRQFRSDIPVEVEKVVLRMLEKDPKDRYRDLEDVLRSMGAATRTRKY